eukprot:m.54133 g.54133  ORF g.54133 m.54133 type:complete len:348 (+) comp15482_c0_seq1:92-1135(+)
MATRATPPGLVRPLFDGPVDVVGDVHGEYGPLLELLDRLGYDATGNNKENRRLVFVGDLVDRGPDSPGVIRVVRRLIEAGKAQMVLGNHELNLLRGERKHGNHWFWGETESICKNQTRISYQETAPSEAWRRATLKFFSSLPLALERSDCRVVHACWKSSSIDNLRSFDGNPIDAYRFFEAEACRTISEAGLVEGDIRYDIMYQNQNPVRVVTSGLEFQSQAPFFSGGKWREVDRCRWWDNDTDDKITYEPNDPLCIIGHYWRRFPAHEEVPQELTKVSGPSLFPCVDPCSALGAGKNIMCVDWSVGIRYEERGNGCPMGGLGTALGALRLPEREVILHDGRKYNMN